jgi:hypothetical protein
MANLDLYLEAERRGILPPDKAALSLTKRGRAVLYLLRLRPRYATR